jgi:hypothetical protein
MKPEIKAYLEQAHTPHQEALHTLRQTILANLPKGFEETMQYKMISYVVPHSMYPAGYHCKPSDALPFISLASQKNFIALHHLGMYAMPELVAWFVAEYPKHSKTKLDMGKGCIRFKNPENIPYTLLAELFQKISLQDWIKCYEEKIRK